MVKDIPKLRTVERDVAKEMLEVMDEEIGSKDPYFPKRSLNTLRSKVAKSLNASPGRQVSLPVNPSGEADAILGEIEAEEISGPR